MPRVKKTILDRALPFQVALQVALRDCYRGGITAFCAVNGFVQSTIQSKFDPSINSTSPSAKEIEILLRDENAQKPILDSIGDVTGCIWIKEMPPGEGGDPDDIQTLNTMVVQLGEMVGEYQKALADDKKVDADEFAKIKLLTDRLCSAVRTWEHRIGNEVGANE